MPKKIDETITIGADPEVVIVKKKDSSVIPAWLVTKGVKDAPVQFMKSEYGQIMAHADGVALEFNVPSSPAGSGRFNYIFQELHRSINGLIGGNDWLWTPVARIEGDTLIHPLANTAGCSEDYSAYSEETAVPRKPPSIAAWGDKRFFGGHIHIGYNKSIAPPWVVARFCDLYLGLPSVRHDKQCERRKVYGLAGLYRTKPYGVEYRTLSNFWMNSAHLGQVARARIDSSVFNMLSFIQEHRQAAIQLYEEMDWNSVQGIIAEEDGKQASELINIVNAQVKPYNSYAQISTY